MVPVLLAAAAAAAAVKLADVVGDDVCVGNGVNMNRGVEVTERKVGLADADIDIQDNEGVEVFVPVKLKAIVPVQEILVDSVAFGDQDPVVVKVPVPLPVPVDIGVSVGFAVAVPVRVPLDVGVSVGFAVVVPVPVPVPVDVGVRVLFAVAVPVRVPVPVGVPVCKTDELTVWLTEEE
jgi:hypothetical protein